MIISDDPSAFYVLGEDKDDFTETFSVLHERDDPFGLALDEVHLMDEGAPSVTAWRNQDPNNIFASVDFGRKDTLDQADTEIKFIRQKLHDLLGGEDPTEGRLASLVFGPSSHLFKAFKKRIPAFKDRYGVFARWLGTFFCCCELDSTLDAIYDDDEIDTRLLASKEEYKLLWQSVSLSDASIACYEDL